MRTALLLLPSLAAVCYTAALPKARDSDVLKREEDDYTLTVTATSLPAKTTVKSTSAPGGIYVTLTKTLTTNPVVTTVKKTASKATTTKKVTTVIVNGTGKDPTTIYKTVTATKPKTTAETTTFTYPTTTVYDDNGDDTSDDSDDSTDDGDNSTDDGGDDYFGFGKRQVWLVPFTTTDYYTPDDPQPTSYGGNWEDWSGWGPAPTTTADDYGNDVVTTTVYTSAGHRHTTTAYQPRVTFLAKRDAQRDDEFDFTSVDSEIEEPEEVDVLEFEETETDNKKREANPQIQFSVTVDIDSPEETYPVAPAYTAKTTKARTSEAPSRTTGGPNEPYGSWYTVATSRATSRPVASTHLSYPGYPVATTRPVATYSYYPDPVATPSPSVEDPDYEDPDSEDADSEDTDDDPYSDDPNDDDKIVNKRKASPQDDDAEADIVLSLDTETVYYEPEEQEVETDNKKRSPAPQVTWWDFPTETNTPELNDTIWLPFQTFDKRALKTGDSACAPESVTVTVTSFIDKPTGLVEVSISRTIIQAGISNLLTSSCSSSTPTSQAQTTFATSTRARVELRD